MYVKRGDMAKKGAPLFRLDDRDLKAQLLVAEANLVAAEAQYERLKAAPQQGCPDLRGVRGRGEGPLYRCRGGLPPLRDSLRAERRSGKDRDHDRYAYLANKATLSAWRPT